MKETRYRMDKPLSLSLHHETKQRHMPQKDARQKWPRWLEDPLLSELVVQSLETQRFKSAAGAYGM